MLKPYPHVYPRVSDVPLQEFKERWPDFHPKEIACRGTGRVAFNFEAMDKLQALRKLRNRPLILNSAYRSPEHNKAVGGAPNSEHLRAEAFDVSMSNHDPTEYEQDARKVGFRGFGFYVRQNFIHADIGRAREWGVRFPKTVTGLPVETQAHAKPQSPVVPVTVGVAGTGAVVAAGETFIRFTDGAPLTEWIAFAVVAILICLAVFLYIKRNKKD